MNEKQTWQYVLLQQLSDSLRLDRNVKALVLVGSLADQAMEIDYWGDIDIMVVVADDAISRLFSSTDWLRVLGRILGIEHHKETQFKTLRLCLDGFRRIDMVLIPESHLTVARDLRESMIHEPYSIIWSKIPSLPEKLSVKVSKDRFKPVAEWEITTIADEFWFKASVAIAKVMRNDLLVGLHLALDLTRDCLVLQMTRRDREEKTNIHRIGGMGNEIVNRLCIEQCKYQQSEILDIVLKSCEVFDDLASDLLDNYEPGIPLVLPTIIRAKEELTSSG